MQNKFQSKDKGFTLVEALVTVIVIGVIGAIAIPSMNAIVRNQIISSTSNEIIATLQSARSEAIKRSTNVRVCFRQLASGNQCRNITDNNIDFIYVFIDIDNDQVFDRGPETELFLSNQLNTEVVYKHPSNTDLQIRRSILFNSKGGVLLDSDESQARGQIGICDDRKDNAYGRIIEITSTGRAQVTRIPAGSTISCT